MAASESDALFHGLVEKHGPRVGLFLVQARNRALDADRRRRRRRRIVERLVSVRHEPAADPADAIAVRDVLECHLEPSDRALLILRYLHGFDAPELAEVFGASPDAIRQRLSRMRRRLRLVAELPREREESRPRGAQVLRFAGDDDRDDDLFDRLLAPLSWVEEPDVRLPSRLR